MTAIATPAADACSFTQVDGMAERFTQEERSWFAALDAEPENDQLRLYFSDWLRDRGRKDVADGFAALGRLPVRADLFCHNGLNAHGKGFEWDDFGTRQWRRGGKKFMYVTSDWYELMDDVLEDHGCVSLRKSNVTERWRVEWWAALAYSRLTPGQREYAERLLKLEGGR